jgi:hypothetical protein
MNKLLEINRELREIPDPRISKISALILLRVSRVLH